MKYRNALVIVFLIIIADQAMKIFIKTHFANGDEVRMLGGWCRLHFIENEGMAYGMKLSESVFGKIVLSSFRLVAVVFGFYLLKQIIERGYRKGIIVCGALVLAGAFGNLIDSMFYGLIFTDSPYSCFANNFDGLGSLLHAQDRPSIAHLCTFGHGYGKFLQGKVVDMLYFPIIETRMPTWVPIWGGNIFVFFEPVFNIADSAISVGVISILIFSYFFRNRSLVQDIKASEVVLNHEPTQSSNI